MMKDSADRIIIEIEGVTKDAHGWYRYICPDCGEEISVNIIHFKTDVCVCSIYTLVQPPLYLERIKDD